MDTQTNDINKWQQFIKQYWDIDAQVYYDALCDEAVGLNGQHPVVSFIHEITMPPVDCNFNGGRVEFKQSYYHHIGINNTIDEALLEAHGKLANWVAFGLAGAKWLIDICQFNTKLGPANWVFDSGCNAWWHRNYFIQAGWVTGWVGGSGCPPNIYCHDVIFLFTFDGNCVIMYILIGW